MIAPRHRLALVWTLVATLVAALAADGCGGDSPRPGAIRGHRLTIYSSQPLSGYQAARGRDIVRAERLALREAGGRVRDWRLTYVALGDADPVTGTWSPALVSANARRAAANPKTIAYIGEMDSGASAIAVPILNEPGILTVSPLDGVTGLTRHSVAAPGEPAKYYPTRRRTFARLVPSDAVQAAALVFYMQDLGVSRLFIVHDDSLYGGRLALGVARAAIPGGVRVVASRGVEPQGLDPRSLAADVTASGADGFLYVGQLQAGVAGLFRAVHRAAPRSLLLAPSALTQQAFAAQLGPAAGRARLTAPMLAPSVLPAAAGRFERRFRAVYGSAPDPAAIYGYAAMSAVLSAMRRAGRDANRRRSVVDAFFSGRARPSLLGTFAIDPQGDTTIRTYGAYRVRDGRLVFDRVLDPLGA